MKIWHTVRTIILGHRQYRKGTNGRDLHTSLLILLYKESPQPARLITELVMNEITKYIGTYPILRSWFL